MVSESTCNSRPFLLAPDGEVGAATVPAGGAGVLPADLEAPVVAQTAVLPDLLHALEVLTELVVQHRRVQLRGLARLEVAVAVEEPRGDLVVEGVGHDLHDALHLLGGNLPSTHVQVNLSLLQDEACHAAPDPPDLRDRVHDLHAPVDVGVRHTNNVLEV